MPPKRVVLLGSTGSIGESTLEVVENLPADLKLVALAANSQWEKVFRQVLRHAPESVALSDPAGATRLEEALDRDATCRKPRVYAGARGLVDMVRATEADIVLGAVSGAAGLPANIAALETGKDLALANKESLVMSGAILTRLARERGRRLIPVDSEHSAVFQSLHAGGRDEVESIILTASGGPFREASIDEMRRATKATALRHPTWKMGAKITIDSATLMNKALEVIEARWLFDLPPEKIRVVIHPQSIVHSLVEFHDGSVVCQLGTPDMKVPIQYALTYPTRKPLATKRLRLEELSSLTFQAPDPGRFPALRLAYDVLRLGGTAPTVLNAANEVAVAAFLREEIAFLDILACVERTVRHHDVVADPTLDEIFAADAAARDAASHTIQTTPSHSR
ncbi:MAG: 1-deoxy-D-xylulose-5-phosphate reductoisomerase [Planctomycetes bacterium]|nr:1-deoxy-D-xylulose-5-phosphate reductoisomerase [Planctomycetota bacterium]